MAVFSDLESYGTLDFVLLQNASVNLYCDPGLLAEDLHWLSQQLYHIDRFDCSAWEDTSAMLDAFSDTLDFPEYFGRNLAALDDCLSDLEIPEEGGWVLVLYQYDEFARKYPHLAWRVRDLLEKNSRWFLRFGRCLITIAHSNDPNLRFPPLGP